MIPDAPESPKSAPGQAETPVVPPTAPPDTLLPWENVIGSEANRHNVRVLCDLAGLDTIYITVNGKKYTAKQIIASCVKQESDFYPLARGHENADGTQDFGLCQYNNGKNAKGVPFWIGQGAPFASVNEVLADPKKNVDVMINCYKAGMIHLWASYSTGAYIKYLGKV